ncbi:sialate O-acetylesterase [Pelagicoccus mobilis]|uniref:Sialate O-acetylesterase domain-containing protein n=1 Tax=Pelagicoccus mobilis TaxID=415221 RepID=A0A934VT88_9BACT|nr:sialate O-acetylesterase [Pelagicoccus mobilis]MBK1879815.1 hypothetical protein [Pelagicoccus mobilis]
MRPLPLCLFALVVSTLCSAEVKLNSIFMDHMVLQRSTPVKIYGTASPGEIVKAEFGEQSHNTTANASGEWILSLDPMKANATSQELTVSGEANQVAIQDVLVGDVWLCTGQSNMQGTLGNYVNFKNGMFEEFKDIPGNYQNENIRFFTVKSEASDTPQRNTPVEQAWTTCTPESSLAFSCTGFFFGKFLQPEIGVPLGLIKSAYGGTAVSSWLPRETMEQNPVASRAYLASFEKAVERYPAAKAKYELALKEWNVSREGKRPQEPMGPHHIKRPAGFYNAMLYPLHNFTIKGAIWYQGENEGNNNLSKEYQTTFKLMIDTWRERWDQGNFPFVFVQLAGHKKVSPEPSDPSWAYLRESQLLTSQNVPNTAMAVAIDGGLTNNIHPPYKALVGKRLAKQALSLAYKKKGLSQGPTYKSHKIKKGNVIVDFKNIGSGLQAKEITLDPYGPNPYPLSSDKLEGFTIAGEDQVFHWAEAKIKGSFVIVSAEAVPNPVAVRYAWANFPLCNLYNEEDFPASPFRTDDW